MTVHDWSRSIDGKNSVHCIFLDFSKAFDSVPHQRLLLKLNCIGIRGSLLRWIEMFLLNRQQRVVIDGVSSSWKSVLSGVPQGSILGPLLFLIYINDIGRSIVSSSIRLFADDCVIYCTINSITDCNLLQSTLSSICQWSEAWQLPLNLSKCKALKLTNKCTSPSFNIP